MHQPSTKGKAVVEAIGTVLLGPSVPRGNRLNDFEVEAFPCQMCS